MFLAPGPMNSPVGRVSAGSAVRGETGERAREEGNGRPRRGDYEDVARPNFRDEPKTDRDRAVRARQYSFTEDGTSSRRNRFEVSPPSRRTLVSAEFKIRRSCFRFGSRLK